MADLTAQRAASIGQSAASTADLQQRFNRAWNRGSVQAIAVYYNALNLRGVNALAWFEQKWRHITNG